MSALERLHQACARLGTRLFTVTELDHAAGVYRRLYSSHPQDYPTGGTKPLERDAYYLASIQPCRPFIANSPEAFRAFFFDHAQIEAMGLGSAANFPLADPGSHQVRLTVNLLAGPGHFTPSRLRRYQALISGAGLV